LQTLNLGGNQLTTLPESIGQLTNLQTLNLEYNQLTPLPENIEINATIR
jgi:Leucine-rich repeat (LRR) protein